NLVYLETLVEPLNRLYEKRRDFTLKVVCDAFPQGFECPVEKVAWSPENEVKELQSFDIGLMPLADDPWTKGKCAFKLLQYMACGRSAVASESEVTREIISDGENGFLASDPAAMVAVIERLLDEPEKLAAIGNAARNSLIGRYDQATVASLYAGLFKELA
ncbi:MAG: glycosyltransferase family 4 protein, partial [Deltaproteobacteria bacterium]|nr:glycosyltransferase family 4 protein [Deltaproteobacteria bacterium]